MCTIESRNVQRYSTEDAQPKTECIDGLGERMKVLDPERIENYYFLGCEQAEQIDIDSVYKGVKAEMDKRMKALGSKKL